MLLKFLPEMLEQVSHFRLIGQCPLVCCQTTEQSIKQQRSNCQWHKRTLHDLQQGISYTWTIPNKVPLHKASIYIYIYIYIYINRSARAFTDLNETLKLCCDTPQHCSKLQVHCHSHTSSEPH